MSKQRGPKKKSSSSSSQKQTTQEIMPQYTLSDLFRMSRTLLVNSNKNSGMVTLCIPSNEEVNVTMKAVEIPELLATRGGTKFKMSLNRQNRVEISDLTTSDASCIIL